MTLPGRNDPCPCGSGRKYKHCCAAKGPAPTAPLSLARAQLEQGKVLERLGRHDEAMTAYKVAALEWPEADSRLGHILSIRGRHGEAAAHYRAAAAADPGRRLDLVRALLYEGEEAEAELLLRVVLAADPSNGDGHWLLGRLLSEAGDFAQAAESFERALADNPAAAGTYYDLARIHVFGEDDRPLIRQMLAALRGASGADVRARVHLALAKAFDDLGDYAAAMRHIAKANQIRNALAPFDRAAITRHADAVIGRFTAAFIASRVGRGDPSRLPVMIVGLPRSGTTLVEQILASHGQVAGAGELRFWPTRDPLFDRRASDAWLARYQADTAREALALLRGLAPWAERVIDKNPFNFLWLGPIHVVFPQATVIHCRRHPVDTCLSIASMYLAPRSHLPVEPADLVFYWRQYQRVMDHWRSVLPGDRFVEVAYEALVADPEPATRRLLATLDLGWDPACLRPEANTRRVRTNSSWQVRQPIHGGSVGRWRRYRPWLGPLRELIDEADTEGGDGK
ncbi:MAG: sulfotransferase [Caulobacteraceae bacterium]